ncbi:tyrosine protein phosphatase [Halobacillus yeomjeoni]|uniref:tyrosine-protein phosphatase n=1 Tax=Halobacillus yeomjeoni TaxID=311194 RepID=UPI001CD3D88E|nr:CpsB/CapC family capsule biosynthesis tyrosine phosphatase [Halobacillus yeomjeoni]MCA0985190.1 tyrosine protein phosphatase [Halobacillus yeomjeoni]
MIDIHSHILPGVDDGAQSIEESIQMAEAAVRDGIDTIVASPHHKNGVYNNYRNDILLQVAELNRHIETRNIPLNVVPGQEVRLYGELIEGIHSEEVLPINMESNYLLVEFPSNTVPRYASQLFYDLQMSGIRPIIAHPERNKKIIENPDVLYSLVKDGAYAQVTAGSVCGNFGKKIMKFSHQLIEHNLAHLIASDAHNTTSRGFCMTEAYQEVRQSYGLDMVYMLSENAQDIIEDKVLAAEPPEHIKTRKLFDIFRK